MRPAAGAASKGTCIRPNRDGARLAWSGSPGGRQHSFLAVFTFHQLLTREAGVPGIALVLCRHADDVGSRTSPRRSPLPFGSQSHRDADDLARGAALAHSLATALCSVLQQARSAPG